ncbi:MAG: putative toxin-antitoxin system toxin component, PIN family [Cyclobacteriaceae bacterium]
MRKNYVVIDTNVFISSLIGQVGYSRKIFDEIVFTNEVKICLSKEVLAEYEEVAQREKFAKYDGFQEKALQLILAIKEIAFWFEPKEIIRELSDEDDNMFLELAVEADASYVVTGNTKDFGMEQFRGIWIVSPKEFYEKWNDGGIET